MSLGSEKNREVFCTEPGTGNKLSYKEILDFVFDEALHPFVRSKFAKMVHVWVACLRIPMAAC